MQESKFQIARFCTGIGSRSVDEPSEFVLCWTADGAQTEQERSAKAGGTGTAIVLASRLKIPVINLARPGDTDRLTALVLPKIRLSGAYVRSWENGVARFPYDQVAADEGVCPSPQP